MSGTTPGMPSGMPHGAGAPSGTPANTPAVGGAIAERFDPAVALAEARAGGVLERSGVSIIQGPPRASGLQRHLELLCNRPLMVRPGRAQQLYAVLGAAARGERYADSRERREETAEERRERRRLERAEALTQRFAAFGSVGQVAGGESAVVGGVAVIDAKGTFVKDRADHGWSGMVSTEVLGREFGCAMDDPGVRSVLFDIDSPGGTVDGSFELAELVASRRGEKPIAGFANGCACSAAYLLLSACDDGDAYAYRTAAVGSIGVIAVGFGMHRMLDEWGIDPFIIKSGRFKDTGTPYRPIEDEDLAELQNGVDDTAALFFGDVAANRKGLSFEAIDALEARVFDGFGAEEHGLIDGVCRFEALLADMIEANGSAPAAPGKLSTPAQ